MHCCFYYCSFDHYSLIFVIVSTIFFVVAGTFIAPKAVNHYHHQSIDVTAAADSGGGDSRRLQGSRVCSRHIFFFLF